MKITEFADIIDHELLITYYPDQNNRWCCMFKNCDIKDGSSLLGVHGNGPSPQEAIASYVAEISGRLLVFNGLSSNRQEYKAHKTLEGL